MPARGPKRGVPAMSGGPVLVTWIAVNNDPYERPQSSDPNSNSEPVPGPTLTLLLDGESPYAGKIHDVVLFHRGTADASSREQHAVSELCDALGEHSIRVHAHPWSGEDPTDHQAVFTFLLREMRSVRVQFRGRELVIHVSPGTPSMHTVWVLMAETGYIPPPFSVVKSYRRVERRGRPAVVPFELGIETFYKAYQAQKPREVASEEQELSWDPAQFKTAPMQRLYAQARRYAQVNVPVLIRGERGTGKTTLAAWIRAHSRFRRPELNCGWPSVACGQYTPETMRAELFGYKKGAFTGAVADRDGLLKAAHKDTLFLDEIGDVSRDLQRLLIKAIEEKRYVPLGDDTPRTSDFRLITATNVDDVELRRRLDPDFLDRISPLTLDVPPLREIAGELDWLWPKVYAEAAQRAGVAQREAALGSSHHERVVSHLARHPLPGNLRDLFRVAYRILAARADAHADVKPAEAVALGLEALEGGPAAGGGEGTSKSRSLARAFADGQPIDDLLDPGGPIATSVLVADLHAFLAGELRRVAKTRQVSVESLCDVNERTLRNWSSPRKRRSEAGKNPSDSDES